MRNAVLAILLALSACSKDQGADPGGRDLAVDPNADLSTGSDGATSACPRLPKADDRERTIVVSHPYKEPSGDKSVDYEVLKLSATGEISRPNVHFAMGRATEGEIVFTPDGELGFVVQEMGSIGVFKLGSGAPQVIEATHMGGHYAGQLVVAPTGDKLYLLDQETENNHGGIYELAIHCDGTLGPDTLVSAADLPYAMIQLPKGKAGVYARSLGGSGAHETAHLVSLGPPFQRQQSVVSFSDVGDDAIIASSAITHDGRFLLFGDNGQFTGVPNRIAAIAFDGSAFTAAQVLTPIEDPVAIVTSPYDNAVLVASGTGDALVRFSYDPSNATTPFVNRGPLTYMGAKPPLPGSAVPITRGTLKDRVFVAQLQGVRQVRFETNGNITDLGAFPLGDNYDAMVGAIGVQP